MRLCGDGDEQQLFEGYVAVVKNTFIDIKKQPARPKRSSSCSPRFELPDFNRALAVAKKKQQPGSAPPAGAGPFAQPGSAPAGGAGPFAVPRPPLARASSSSSKSTGAPLKLVRDPPASPSSDGAVPAIDAPHDAASTTCSTSASDQGAFPKDHAEFVESQYRKYLVNMDNSGQTLMWHGLPTKYQVEPHLLNLLATLEAEGVGYLYVPLNHWETKDKPRGRCRNKGYAFIHFYTEEAATAFTKKVTEYFKTEKSMLNATTKAAFQGISANLRALVAAPQKRTTAGSFYLLNRTSTLERVSIREFRDLFNQAPQDDRTC